MTPFFEQLEGELNEAALRLHRRRHRRAVALRLAAVAATILVVIGGLAVAANLGNDEATAEVRITEQNGTINVSLPRGHEPADEVAESLEEAGLRVLLTPSATGPSQVGTVVGMFSSDSPPMTSEGTIAVEVPRGDTVTLLVGEPTTGSYTAFTDALAPGEPLHCFAWNGQSAADLDRRIPSGLNIEYQTTTGERVAPESLSGHVVKSATALSPTSVRVTVEIGTAIDAPPCD